MKNKISTREKIRNFFERKIIGFCMILFSTTGLLVIDEEAIVYKNIFSILILVGIVYMITDDLRKLGENKK